MKTEQVIEARKSNTETNDKQPNVRRRASKTARAAVAIGTTFGAIAGLSACTAEATQPLEQEFKVGNVMLETDLAESRQNVLELCNTGEGADEVKQEWKDFGFEERSGMEWIDALKFVADLRYMSDDPNAIVNYGSYTYPTTEALAENCLDAAFLLSQLPNDVAYPETAVPLLEEFHTADGSDPVIPLERIFNTIQASDTTAEAQE
jgi:hypothetical protein